jgi:hypothetical protein
VHVEHERILLAGLRICRVHQPVLHPRAVWPCDPVLLRERDDLAGQPGGNRVVRCAGVDTVVRSVTRFFSGGRIGRRMDRPIRTDARLRNPGAMTSPAGRLAVLVRVGADPAFTLGNPKTNT